MSITGQTTPPPPRRLGRRRPQHLSAVADAEQQGGCAHLDPYWAAVVIRPAVAADRASLRRLAQLDSAPQRVGEAVLAEQSGSVVAAVWLRDGAVIADPFVATADLVELLRLRAAQLRRLDAAQASKTGISRVLTAGPPTRSEWRDQPAMPC